MMHKEKKDTGRARYGSVVVELKYPAITYMMRFTTLADAEKFVKKENAPEHSIKAVD